MVVARLEDDLESDVSDSSGAFRLEPFALGLPSSRHRSFGLTVKRGLDIALGLALGVIAVPLMLAVALAISADSPGPVLYRAKRVGRDGRQFAMYKFRTMVKDADERLHELAHLNVAQGMTKSTGQTTSGQSQRISRS